MKDYGDQTRYGYFPANVQNWLIRELAENGDFKWWDVLVEVVLDLDEDRTALKKAMENYYQ